MILPDISGIGYRGRCILGVISLKSSHRLTRATGSSSLYQHVERIVLPVGTLAILFYKTMTTRDNEDD